MHRTNSLERRSALLFVSITLGAITLICALFLVTGTTIPEWFTIIGRWLPALVSLVVLKVAGLGGGIVHWWSLKPGGWKRLVLGVLVGLYGLFVVYTVGALLAWPFGARPQSIGFFLQAALIAIPYALLFSLSTFGEEVGWRGFLQNLLREQGFWRMATIVSAVWVAFHVPLHGAMALQGTLPPTMAILSTIGLFPLGIFLSAAVARFSSVWPAVVGHALPMSALNLVANADTLSLGSHIALTLTTTAALVAATIVLRRTTTRGTSASDYQA